MVPLLLCLLAVSAQGFNILEFGAVPDANTIEASTANSKAITSVIYVYFCFEMVCVCFTCMHVYIVCVCIVCVYVFMCVCMPLVSFSIAGHLCCQRIAHGPHRSGPSWSHLFHLECGGHWIDQCDL